MDEIQEAERIKYERVWSDRAYAAQADGDPVVDLAYSQMGCKPGETLIDWGCGCGRPAAKLRARGLSVTGIDIAYNCLDADVKIPFLKRCLWDLPDDGLEADYAFSTDVLEHIPPRKLATVLDNIYTRTRKAAFIQVCIVLDDSGPKMNPPERLHLSVFPRDVWYSLLQVWWKRVVEIERVGGKARRSFVCFKE